MKALLKKRNQANAPAQKTSDKAAGWIASGILKVQNRWVQLMDNCFNRRSLKARKAMLAAVFLFAIAYSGLLFAFSYNKGGIVSIKPTSMVQLSSIGKTNTRLPTGVPAFVRRIERFRFYLDSLSQSDSGEKLRDSILQNHPGLLDSIKMIETIYCGK